MIPIPAETQILGVSCVRYESAKQNVRVQSAWLRVIGQIGMDAALALGMYLAVLFDYKGHLLVATFDAPLPEDYRVLFREAWAAEKELPENVSFFCYDDPAFQVIWARRRF